MIKYILKIKDILKKIKTVSAKHSIDYIRLLMDYEDRSARVCVKNNPGTLNKKDVHFYDLSGQYFISNGNYQKARIYFEKALQIRQEVLGADHPETANSLNNLGSLYIAVSDLKNARVCFEKAIEIRKKRLGELHKDTANSLNNLAMLEYRENNVTRALMLMKAAHSAYLRVLGPDHPRTRDSQNGIEIIQASI